MSDDRPEMPEFPVLDIRMDENGYQTAMRWRQQLAEFKIAWDAWATDVDRRLNG